MTETEIVGNKRKQETPLSTLLREAEDRFLLVGGFNKKTTFMIFLNTGHILRPEFRNKVDVTWLLFMLENKESRSLTGNDIDVSLKINFTRLSQDTIDEIVKRISIAKNYPFSINNPFNFPYEFFGFFLPANKDIGKILSSWCDLMVSEWRVIHGKRLFVGFGYDEFSKNLEEGNDPEIYSKFNDPKIDLIKTQGIELKSLRGLWLANEMIIRIRAIWDKLLGELLLNSYFDTSIPNKLSAKCRKLQRLSQQSDLTEKQLTCLHLILENAQLIDEIKEWRDHDVHMVSETIQGVFTKDEASETLYSLWLKINEIHNITREAIFACIGFLTLGTKLIEVPYLDISGSVVDRLKKYDPSRESEKEKLEELRTIARTYQLDENEEKVREIIFNLWRLELSPNKINFNYEVK